MTSRRRLVVSGRVQGVFYRAACKAEADRLGLAGWARNRDDGRVEVVVEGAAGIIEHLVRWCHDGPPHARVTSVEVTTEAPEGLTGFRAR
jgi:acylphosphatase